MKPTRIAAAALALTVVSATAHAQTYTFSRTELGRIVPSRFVTTTQQLLASVDIAAPTRVVAVEATTSDKFDLVRESLPTDSWGIIPLHEDKNRESADSSSSFMSSTMGRATIAGLAGLAGASYFALRAGDTRAQQDNLFYTVGNTLDIRTTAGVENGGIAQSLPAVIPLADVVPEPASTALLAFGLGALGIAARRRRTN